MKDGIIENGDSIECINRDENRVTVSDFNRIINGEPEIADIIFRASKIDALPSRLKSQFL